MAITRSSSISISLILVALSSQLTAHDNPHFYRATNFFGEPRLTRSYLSSLDFSFGAGSSSTARNQDGTKVPLFDIYGTNNMRELGQGVPGKDLTNNLDLALQNLAMSPSRDCFANLSIDGTFSIKEAIFCFNQNLYDGFFINAHLPIRAIESRGTCYADLSPDDAVCPNKNSPEWQTFLALFDDILARYQLSKNAYKKSGPGDLTVCLGWTNSYQDTEVLDFIDSNLRIGVLAPLSKPENVNNIFAVPLGYNHWGLTLNAALALGLFEWVTFGGYAEAMIFKEKTECVRIKTAPQQSGIIKLAKTEASVNKGGIFLGGVYAKADHMIQGFSFTFGYSFARENATKLELCDQTNFSSAVANTDAQLQEWNMHTLHFIFDYDFNSIERSMGPRLGAYIDLVIGGKRIYTTTMGGCLVGLDMSWNF